MKKHIIAVVACLLAVVGLRAEKVYEASAFGVEPNTGADVAGLVDKMLAQVKADAAGKPVTIRFAEGRYDFYPESAAHREYYISNHDQHKDRAVGIAIEGFHGLTLDGQGADFIFHGRMLPLSVVGTEECTLRNFSIDFATPHIAQAEVVKNDAEQGITFRVAPWVNARVTDQRHGDHRCDGGGCDVDQIVDHVLELAEGEKITAMISIHEFAEGEYLTMVTKQGIIKRTLLTEYAYHRKGGKIALALKEGDELVFVTHTYGYPTDLMIATKQGSAVRFTVDDESVRPMGRTAAGVRGIKLRGDDYVVGVATVTEGKSLITITENGYGKRTDFDDFRQMKHRGGHGVTCHALSDKTGLLSGINIVDDNDDVMIITDAGTMIRTSAANIPTYSRSAGGVRVMRLAEGQKIVNFTKLARQDEIENDIAEAENDAEISAPVENLPAEDEILTLEQDTEMTETEDTVEE